MAKKMIVVTTKEYMANLSVEELEEWLDFKEGLLNDTKLQTVSKKEDMDVIRKEVSILTEEISRRKFKEIFNKIGRVPYSKDVQRKPFGNE